MAAKPIKNKIRTPVLALITVVPLVTLLLFNVGIRIYLDRSARNELQTVAKAVETVARKELAGNPRGFTANRLDGAFAKIYKAVGASKLSANTKVLLYSRQRKLLYPQSGEDGFVTRQLTDTVSARLESMKEKKVYTVRMDGATYYLISYALTNLAGEQPVMVFLSQPGDANALIGAINLILIVIMIIGAALASLFANRIAQRIAEPVTELSALTEKIGKGEFALPAQPKNAGDIAEIDRLYDSIGKMAAKLDVYDKTQKTFLQNASHELKTPLMSIQGYAEGIENGVLPDVKHAAGIICSESKRLNTLVEELLTLSRIESQTYARELTVTNLNNALKEYVQRLGGYSAKLGRRLTLHLPDEPAMILADDTLLSQAVMNIASNCLRYAGTGADISLLPGGNGAVIRISDDGGGIPEKDLPHIFERFYKGSGGNFGLGLAIAKSASEYMGGRVKAYNGDRGAVFELSFPVRNETETA